MRYEAVQAQVGKQARRLAQGTEERQGMHLARTGLLAAGQWNQDTGVWAGHYPTLLPNHATE